MCRILRSTAITALVLIAVTGTATIISSPLHHAFDTDYASVPAIAAGDDARQELRYAVRALQAQALLLRAEREAILAQAAELVRLESRREAMLKARAPDIWTNLP